MGVLVAGMGVTGQAVARFLARKEAPFDTFDDSKTSADIASLSLSSHNCHFSDVTLLPLENYEEIILSPGFGPRHPLVIGAIESKTPLISEIGFAHRFAKGRFVAVTGTNGKSTTVSLMHHLFTACGLETRLCGNIGVPLIECVDAPENTIFIIEVSSFQMAYPGNFRPEIGVLLNLSPDHLDWHGSFAHYRDAKFRLFAHQTADDLAFAGSEWVSHLPGEGEKIAVPGPYVRVEEDAFCIGETYRVPLTSLALMGEHNRHNALFSIAAAAKLGLPAAQVADTLPSFRGLEHRLETVGTLDGRIWINDTKATNVHAARAVIEAMDRDFVLILGGYDKQEDFSELTFSRSPVATVVYGNTASRIQAELPRLHAEKVDDFFDACRRAHQLAKAGQAVLLAPACASFGQFANYIERGKAFKRLFCQMGGEL